MIRSNRPSETDEIQLTENAYGAMIAWIAGPQWARPSSSQVHPQVETVTLRPNIEARSDTRRRKRAGAELHR